MGRIPWICPECRTEQQKRPEHLPRNFFLERSVQSFIESRNNFEDHSDQERNVRLEQLDQLQQQLAQQQEIAAEAVEMKRQLSNQKNLIDDMSARFQQANEKIAKTHRERTHLEQRINELQFSIKDLEQKQQEQLQEQLAKQRQNAAEAEERKRQLDNKKIRLEDICEE